MIDSFIKGVFGRIDLTKKIHSKSIRKFFMES